MTRRPVPLRAALERALTPGVSPSDLERAGPFLLTDYTARHCLTPGRDDRVFFGVLPLEGDLAGVEHLLELRATAARIRLGLVILDLGLVGPVVLVRRALDAVTTIWDFAEELEGGELWTPLADVAEYQRDARDTFPQPEPI